VPKNNFAKYSLAAGLSSFGDGMQNIALPWLILSSTKSPMAIGLAIAIKYIPSLIFAPFAGVLSDRLDSKKTVIIVDGIQAILVSLIFTYAYFELDFVYFLYILQFLLGLAYTIYKPADKTLVREAFYDTEIIKVSSRISPIYMIAALLGAGFAGFIISIFSLASCFAINALSFVFAIAINSGLIRVQKRQLFKRQHTMLKDLSLAWSYVKEKEGMLELLLLTIIGSASLRIVITILSPYVVFDLSGDSRTYGLLEMSFTAGGAITGFFVQPLLRYLGNNLFRWTILGIAISSVLLGLSSNGIISAIILFCLGFFTMTHLVSMHSLLTINSPKDMLGRIVGLRGTLASAIKVFSALVAGFAVTATSASTVFIIFGLIAFVSLFFPLGINKVVIPQDN